MFDTQELSGPASDVASGALPLPSPGSQPVHILDRLNAVFKHRRIAGSTFALVVAVMMIQTYSTTPTYRTASRILIDDERTTQVGTLNANDPVFWQDPDQYYKTQYSILQSRGLAARVVRRLDLEHHPEYMGGGPRPTDPLSLIRQGRAAASAWVRSLFARPRTPTIPPPEPTEDAKEASLVSAFLGGLQIAPEPQTRLVSIVYVHSSPEFAALAANAVAEEYTQQNLDLRLQNTEKMLSWLDDELKRQEAAVMKSEGALSQYRESNNALSLEDRQNIVLQQLNSTNTALSNARTARLTREAAYNQVRSADPASDAADSFPAIGSDPGVIAAKNKVATLEAEKTALAQKYGPNMPQMQQVATELANAKRQLVAERGKVIESVKNQYEAAAAEERSLGGQLEQAKQNSMDLDRKSGDYNILKRQADSDRTVYQSLLTQQKELRVVANSRANNVQVLEHAEVPKFPISPNPRRDWLLAILAGVAAAFGLAFAIEYLDDSVKTPEDITRRFKLPLLGLVPAVRGEQVPVLTQTVPHDFGEAFRSLRTSLVFTSGSEHTRIVAVTSSQPLEGKTTTAANLALALALGGSRVLLIDADMRRPGLHKTIGIGNEVGLSHVLVGQARVRDAIQRTAEPNLVMMSAGRIPPNPSELLASERMTSFLTNLQTGPFDWVIIDTPPVLAVTDAVILSPRVSGIVFVVGSEMTRRVHAERALETIRSSRPRSISAVLNRVDFDRNKYYYSRYYGYQYKSYYGQNNAPSAA
jgi:capsular exopolysaccharide synthesis family protein